MKLRMNTICIFLIVLFIPQILLADSHQSGNTESINVSAEDRAAWQTKSKVFKNYNSELNDIGGDLVDKVKENQIYLEAGMYITDIAVVLGLLEIVYKLNANCIQTDLTARDFYKQVIIALSYTLNVVEYKQSKIDELYNKTKETDALPLIGRGKEIIIKLQKILYDEREDVFSKKRKITK
jgi:hypothetical protein